MFLTAGRCVTINGETGELAASARIYFQQDAGADYDPVTDTPASSGYPYTGGVTASTFYAFAHRRRHSRRRRTGSNTSVHKSWTLRPSTRNGRAIGEQPRSSSPGSQRARVADQPRLPGPAHPQARRTLTRSTESLTLACRAVRCGAVRCDDLPMDEPSLRALRAV